MEYIRVCGGVCLGSGGVVPHLSFPAQGEDVSERIIPSLDRGLYHWDGNKLTQLPFTADNLIDHTHLMKGRGSILAGAKANDVVGVNIHTGKVIPSCHMT